MKLFGFLKNHNDKTKTVEITKPTSVSITIQETLVFTGTVESIDIHQELLDGEAQATIKVNAGEIIRQLRTHME